MLKRKFVGYIVLYHFENDKVQGKLLCVLIDSLPPGVDNSGVARQLCARGRAMKLAPPTPSLFFRISKFSFEILEFKF